MFPLLKRDQLVVPYYIMTIIFIVIVNMIEIFTISKKNEVSIEKKSTVGGYVRLFERLLIRLSTAGMLLHCFNIIVDSSLDVI